MRRRLDEGMGRGPVSTAIGRVEARPLATARRGLTDAAIGAGLVVGSTALVVLVARIGYVSKIEPIGVLVLASAKLLALVAMGAGEGWRGTSPRSTRHTMIEAVTMGALLAFVSTLALGKAAPLPRSLLVADWLATLAVVGLVQRTTRRPGNLVVDDSEVLAAIHDRVVVAVWPGGRSFHAMKKELDALRPSRLVVCCDAGIGAQFKELRPDVVLVADDGGHASAMATRKLANAALGAGVECFTLVTTGRNSGSPSLSERIVHALAGLTRTRMVRIRAGEKPIGPGEARRISRIVAKGQDRLGYPVGEAQWEEDAATLWKELNLLC